VIDSTPRYLPDPKKPIPQFVLDKLDKKLVKHGATKVGEPYFTKVGNLRVLVKYYPKMSGGWQERWYWRWDTQRWTLCDHG
jgi:hypothetical protein